MFPFAAEGYAVLCYDVPGVDSMRLARDGFTAVQNYNRGPGDPDKKRVQEGLESAIAHLEKAGVIDRERIALTGLSFGAEAVSYGLFHMPGLAAAIASGGGYEPSSPMLSGPHGRDLLAAWGLDSPSSPRWESLSLARNAHRVRAPLLLNVADREMIAWLESFTALQDAGRAVEMHVFPDEYHIKWQPAHRLAVYKRNIDWLNFWLQDKEDPNVSLAEQYARWRKLREQLNRPATARQ